MLLQEMLILTTPPDSLTQVRQTGLTPAHLAYRIGQGPHLFRSGAPIPIKGGFMVMDAQGFDGRGDPTALCQEVVRECAGRGFCGVICDFEGRPLPLLERIVAQLDERLKHRKLSLYVPEPYGSVASPARVLIASALSGGSLTQRLSDAICHFGGPDRIALAVERVAEDFFLPSPTGSGHPLTPEELARRIQERSPCVFFSQELCARYFTYMTRDSGAHFVLFDDAASIRKKLQIAQSLGISRAVAAWPEIDDLLDQILRPC